MIKLSVMLDPSLSHPNHSMTLCFYEIKLLVMLDPSLSHPNHSMTLCFYEIKLSVVLDPSLSDSNHSIFFYLLTWLGQWGGFGVAGGLFGQQQPLPLSHTSIISSNTFTHHLKGFFFFASREPPGHVLDMLGGSSR